MVYWPAQCPVCLAWAGELAETAMGGGGAMSATQGTPLQLTCPCGPGVEGHRGKGSLNGDGGQALVGPSAMG